LRANVEFSPHPVNAGSSPCVGARVLLHQNAPWVGLRIGTPMIYLYNPLFVQWVGQFLTGLALL
jgi:hypothetical protein